MSNPSSRSHLYRLGIVLIAGLVAFLVIKDWATPASWNYEDWYRGDAVKDAAAQALVYGGNESCEACHAEVNEKVASLAHSGLSCESCHGALGDHVEGGKKVAAAPVDKTMWQCLNCHEERINRPEDLPQFPGDVGRHEDIEEGTTCYKCHDAHDPTP